MSTEATSPPFDLQDLSIRELLNLRAATEAQLRKRDAVRSANILGDIAELLFCRAFGWTQSKGAAKGVDAICPDGKRYQIKGCRLSRGNPARQLSALRGLKDCSFDHLAAVLLDSDFSVRRAAIVPHALVLRHAKYDTHTNSGRFYLRDRVWTLAGVRDVTEELRNVKL